MTTAYRHPPLLIGLTLDAALRQAEALGWQVAEIKRSVPPSRAPSGRERVIAQKTIGEGRLVLIAAASIELDRP